MSTITKTYNKTLCWSWWRQWWSEKREIAIITTAKKYKMRESANQLYSALLLVPFSPFSFFPLLCFNWDFRWEFNYTLPLLEHVILCYKLFLVIHQSGTHFVKAFQLGFQLSPFLLVLSAGQFSLENGGNNVFRLDCVQLEKPKQNYLAVFLYICLLYQWHKRINVKRIFFFNFFPTSTTFQPKPDFTSSNAQAKKEKNLVFLPVLRTHSYAQLTLKEKES